MEEVESDPYELHATRFLNRHQQISERFYRSLQNIEDGRVELAKCWPQILAAFGWALSRQSASTVAKEFCLRFAAGRSISGSFVLLPNSHPLTLRH